MGSPDILRQVPMEDMTRLPEFNLNWLPLESYTAEIAKAGFDLNGEYARRQRLQQQFGEENGDLIWVKGVTDEVTEHAFEYSRGDLVRFPPSYQIIEDRLFSPRFVAFADELTSSKERGGSVLRGLDTVGQQLASTPEGSLVIWSSPDGPLDVDDIDGRHYDYSWTHMFQRRGTKVDYISLRSDFSLSEHARFLNLFLPPEKQLDSDSLGMPAIQKILETPAVVLPSRVNFIRENYNGVVCRNNQTGESYSFNEAIVALEEAEKRRSLEFEAIENIVGTFEKQLLREGLTREQTLRIMGQYLLYLNHYYQSGDQNNQLPSGMDSPDLYVYPPIDFFGLIGKLQQVGGCAGTTRQNTRTFSSHQSEETFEGKCPVCGKQVRVDLGEKCPGCKTVYACG